MTGPFWKCDNCEEHRKSRFDFWPCPGCNKEVCEGCFDRFGHCKECSKGKTDEELRLAANATGNFDFSPLEQVANDSQASSIRND